MDTERTPKTPSVACSFPFRALLARLASLTSLFALATSAGCGSSSSGGSSADDPMGAFGGSADAGTGGSYPYPSADTGAGWGGPSDAAAGGDTGGGSFAGVGTGGAQDFAAFRKALDEGRVPDPSTLDAGGFFAEHFTTLPDPTCGKTFCLHAMLSVAPDLVRGGDWTLLQMGMNSPIDPATVKRPALDLAVVLDHSGSMAGAKMEYAKQGVQQLVDAMTADDTFTLIEFDSSVHTIFGPAKITDKPALKGLIGGISPAGGTDIYGGLEAGYKAALGAGDESKQRRVIFLTDGVATAGITDAAQIKSMSSSYNDEYVGLTTIGLGSDADGALLRSLSEKGGGNYYFVENAAAVTEVFTEELAFFVAPIAYDLDLTLQQAPSYSVKEIFGTNLWTPAPGGGTVHVPSVFLVSRTSTAPGATGGRRGGGSAIVAQLAPGSIAPTTSPYDVATVKLRYRIPGSTTYEEQTVPVTHDGVFGVAPSGGFFTDPTIEKNTVILDFFVAFRDATKLAQTDRVAAKKLLTDFRPKAAAAIAKWTDEDLQDDLKIVDEYIGVLK